MLPGFRILFAIVLLSVSLLIFGLGAAAFLRSAHENIASAPLWKPIEAPVIARMDSGQANHAPPTLAMLRVEPETEPPARTTTAQSPSAPPAEPVATVSAEPTGDASASARADEPRPAALVTTPPAGPQPSTTAVVSDQPPPGPPTEAAHDGSASAAPASEAAAQETASVSEDPTRQTSAPVALAALVPEPHGAPPSPAAPAAPIAVSAAAPSASASADTAASDGVEKPASSVADTLKADDRMIEIPPPATIAALNEAAAPSNADIKPLPAREVRIPRPRVDPAAREAHRRQLAAKQKQQARVRATQAARRVAAARAHAIAQARANAAAAAASNPFGFPPVAGTN